MGGIGSFLANNALPDIGQLATDQRTAAMQELPYQGDLWAYVGPEELVGPAMVGGETTREGFYTLTPKGKRYLAIAGLAVAAGAFLVLRGS